MRVTPTTFAGKIRFAGLLVVLILMAYFSQAQVIAYRLGYTPEEGDIIFQSLPHADLVDAIEGITHSPYSHCGVLLKEKGEWVVFESIGHVHGTPLMLWMQRGRGAAMAVYRLRPEYQKYRPEFLKQLLAYAGYNYDYDYKISDDEIYCSELPYQAYLKATGQPLGKLEKLGDLDWKPYEAFIRSVQGNKLPLDREMITPKSLSEASQLQEVYRRGF
ncbi:MAG: hypothetical protein B9S32_00175 [Verrucomicrobia bacterium Tous-C9LFEB]|nr:MAG: hypothetical protein B9S32_00175 [Verrucomicrobia bacterium Tous-C9LFEB]